MPANLYIGYLRLSIDDGDFEKHAEKIESNSITNQRKLIADYLKVHPIKDTDTYIELADDGYSGTNFNRPQMKKLLEWVKQGIVKCIIVKDISRFSRDYIEVGNYLEQVFPFLGIRFISIIDQYDSTGYQGVTGGMDIAFRNLMYSLYSKDLSVKTLCARDIRIKKGYFTGGLPPFGYEFATKNKRKLKPDPVAAEYVKHIFELALSCEGTGKIARILNQEGVPTPAVYKNRRKKIYSVEEKWQYWDARKVRTVLQNKTYLGIIVNRNHKVVEVGAKRFVRVPEKDRAYSIDQHEAVISEELFARAQNVFQKRGEQEYKIHYKNTKNMLEGLLYCPVCKKALCFSKRKKSGFYYCQRPIFDEKAECTKNKLDQNKIERVVFTCIQMLIRLQNSQNETPEYRINKKKKIDHLAIEVNRLKVRRQSLHDEYHSGILSKEKFISEKEYLKNLIECKEEEQVLLSKGADAALTIPLSRESVHDKIERIWVYDGDRIEIKWSTLEI